MKGLAAEHVKFWRHGKRKWEIDFLPARSYGNMLASQISQARFLGYVFVYVAANYSQWMMMLPSSLCLRASQIDQYFLSH